jgi:hypothetical protein
MQYRLCYSLRKIYLLKFSTFLVSQLLDEYHKNGGEEELVAGEPYADAKSRVVDSLGLLPGYRDRLCSAVLLPL